MFRWWKAALNSDAKVAAEWKISRALETCTSGGMAHGYVPVTPESNVTVFTGICMYVIHIQTGKCSRTPSMKICRPAYVCVLVYVTGV